MDSTAAPTRRRTITAAAALMAGALIAAGCSGDDDTAAPARTTTTTEAVTTTTEAPTTTVPSAAPTITPLTGEPVASADMARMARPALAVKIDNSTDAMPQEGLNLADVIFEIKVEGISRLMAVFHSRDAGEIGPTRSARYSDPPILALLGRPLFGWSGANDGVIRAVENADWVVNVNWDRFPKEYFRKSGRKAPHNLFTSTDKLFAHAEGSQGPPPQMFQFLEPAQAVTNGASPLPGVSLRVGDTPSSWAWDAGKGRWMRWQYGRRDMTADGEQADAVNVAIVEITYKGGSKAPIARTEGTGKVTVLTAGGNAVVGTWSRPSQLEPITYTGPDGQPIRFAPGRTWVEFTDGATAVPLGADQAAALLAG